MTEYPDYPEPDWAEPSEAEIAADAAAFEAHTDNTIETEVNDG